MVTGAWLSASRIDPDAIRSAVARPFDVRDSKKVFSQKGLGRGELAALSVIRALTGRTHCSGRELLDDIGTWKGAPHGCDPCPCSPGALELPLWADGAEVEERSARLALALEQAGMRETGVHCLVICPRELNALLAPERSKLDVDLEAFLEVAWRIRRAWPRDGAFTCGKVGNRKAYGAALGPGHGAIAETRERSAYTVPGLGEIGFLLDADDSDPLVSMASLVGKYVRELVMESLHGYVEAREPGLPRPSGYHDPVTARWFEAALPHLLGSGVEHDCVERKR